jgi:gluconate 2-dehydrogenase gamma chain
MPVPLDPLSRRSFVGAVAGSLAASWIAGARLPPGPAAGPGLAPAQLRDLDAITSLILPTDDTPGAREARVVDFIDRALTSFAALPAADAIALLAALEAEGSPFFEAVRVATITGYLANPEYGGNAGKVGWQAIGFDDRFVWSAPFGWYDGEGAAEE